MTNQKDRLLTDEELYHFGLLEFLKQRYKNRKGEKLAIKLADKAIAQAQDAKSVKARDKEIADEMINRAEVGLNALPKGEQGFWKGYWQGWIDKGQALKRSIDCDYCGGVGTVPTGQTNEIPCPKCRGV